MGEPQRIDAVLFDAAGTLILPMESVGATYSRLAADFGVRLSAARLDDAFRRVFAAAPPNVHPDEPSADIPERERAWWRARVRETFRAADGTAHFDEFDRFFTTLFEHYADPRAWRLAPGAHEGLAALAARRLPLGVLSNFDHRLPGLLEGLGVAEAFACVVLPAEARAAKPDPAIFAFALERMGVSPDRALYVGDHAEEDLAGARGAGLSALDVASLADLRALPKAIDRLEPGAA
jgi:putative hydrolase of the HAD superfamily